jgi:hypothetical protein
MARIADHFMVIMVISEKSIGWFLPRFELKPWTTRGGNSNRARTFPSFIYFCSAKIVNITPRKHPQSLQENVTAVKRLSFSAQNAERIHAIQLTTGRIPIIRGRSAREFEEIMENDARPLVRQECGPNDAD